MISDSEKLFITLKLKEEGLSEPEICLDDKRNFFVIKNKEQEIIAFFCLTHIDFDCTPFMILEYFWLHPSKRKQGVWFKKIAKEAERELLKLGHGSVIIDVKKGDIPLIEKVASKAPYGLSENSGFFFVEFSKIKLLKEKTK